MPERAELAIDLRSLTVEERRHWCWTQGYLRHLVLPHQLPLYDRFWAWWATMGDPEVIRKNQEATATYHNLMTFLCSRRFGKSTVALIIATEMMIRYPGSAGLITTTTRTAIGAIVLKPIEDVMGQDAPPDYLPIYQTQRDGLHDVLVLPATGSTARLHGLDLHPNRLRGPGLDWCVTTEAGFCSYDLEETYRSKITQQFRGRPHAWALMESSCPESQDHPFYSSFCADAEKRGAHQEFSILDQGLAPEEIRYWEDQSGGPTHPTTRRELYNEFLPDRERAVCSSLTTANIIAPYLYEPPKYGLGIVGLDPGNTDMAGLVWLVVEPSKRQAVCIASWGGTKTSTDDLAGIIRERERELWGTKAETKVVEEKRPLQDILKAPREVPLQTVTMESLSIDNPTVGGWYQVFDAPDGTCTWWDDTAKTLRPNPWIRVMDVDPQQLQDMRERHGLMFSVPGKGRDNMTLQIDLLNDHLHDGTLKILDNQANAPLLKQMRSGRWNERRKDFERSKQLGHLDIVVALAIACRMIRWDIDPRRPLFVDPSARGLFTPPSTRKLMEPLRSKEKERRSVRGKRYRWKAGQR